VHKKEQTPSGTSEEWLYSWLCEWVVSLTLLCLCLKNPAHETVWVFIQETVGTSCWTLARHELFDRLGTNMWIISLKLCGGSQESSRDRDTLPGTSRKKLMEKKMIFSHSHEAYKNMYLA
jgi:hypothetical protein